MSASASVSNSRSTRSIHDSLPVAETKEYSYVSMLMTIGATMESLLFTRAVGRAVSPKAVA